MTDDESDRRIGSTQARHPTGLAGGAEAGPAGRAKRPPVCRSDLVRPEVTNAAGMAAGRVCAELLILGALMSIAPTPEDVIPDVVIDPTQPAGQIGPPP